MSGTILHHGESQGANDGAHSNSASNGSHSLSFSRFANKADDTPQRIALDWPEVCALLSKRRFTRSDSNAAKDGPLLSGASYPERVWRRDGATKSEVFDAKNETPEDWRAPVRCNDFAEFVSLAILDFDGGATLEQIKAGVSRLNNGAGAAAFIYSTFSHDPDAGAFKYRLILPMLKPVASADWPDVWPRLALAFDGAPDRSAKDAARIHYLPSCPKAREHLAVALELDGAALDVSTLPALPVEQRETPVFAPQNAGGDLYARAAFEKEIGRLCATTGNRNDALNQIARRLGQFIGAGRLDRADVESALLNAASANGYTAKDGATEARATMKSGLDAGQCEPNFKGMPDERSAVSSLGARALPQLPQSNAQPAEGEVFETFTFADMMNEPRVLWLIRGVLKERTISVLSADSGGFKSFFALEMALCIATGTPFFGREVQRGTVVYGAAEGYEELLDRARAWSQVRGVPLPSNFHAIKVPVNLADGRAKAKIVTTIKKLEPAFLVLDTLSQNALGIEENSNTAMAMFTAGMAEVGSALGAHVQVVHHNSKAGGFRGAGSIKGNVDTLITLERPEGDQNNTVFVRCEKQRSKKFEPFALCGEEIEIEGAFDEYGDAITSLVFQVAGNADIPEAKHPNAKRADKTRARLLEVFDKVAAQSADGVKVGAWKSAVEEADPPICKDASFWNYRKTLESEGEIEPCGSHNGSPLFRRAAPTPTTPTTPNWSCRSQGTNTPQTYSNNSNNPLGVGVVGVGAGSAENQTKNKSKIARAAMDNFDEEAAGVDF